MKRWLLLLYFPFSSYAQCDLELLGFNAVEGLATVAFHNTNGCGGTGGPDGVSEIQFGFQAVDEDCNPMNIGWDFRRDFLSRAPTTIRGGYFLLPLLSCRETGRTYMTTL